MARTNAETFSRRSGHWIADDYGYNRCSECGYEVDEWGEAYPFCPHCGACMEPDDELSPTSEGVGQHEKVRLIDADALINALTEKYRGTFAKDQLSPLKVCRMIDRAAEGREKGNESVL